LYRYTEAVNLSELRRKNPIEQAAMANRKVGLYKLNAIWSHGPYRLCVNW
jgi:hypothetical protein